LTTSPTQLPAGSNSITATYSGPEANYAASGPSNAVTQTINQASSATTLSTALATAPSVPVTSSNYGNSVILTATVTGSSSGTPGNPTSGTVTFKNGTVALTGTVVYTSTLSGYVATLTTTATQLTLGLHSLTAVYNGNTNFKASAASTPPVSFTVNKAVASVTVSAMIGTNTVTSSTYGQAVTFVAAIGIGTGGTPGTPTGTVSFYLDGSATAFASNIAVVGGVAKTTTTTTFLAANVSPGHSIKAVYTSTNTNIVGNNNTLSNFIVQKDSTTLGLTSSPAVWGLGQATTFTVTVANSSFPGIIPTGTVHLVVTDPSSNTTTLTGTLSAGKVTFHYTFPSGGTKGSYTVAANYLGATNFTTSTNTLAQAQVLNATTLSLAASPSPGTAGSPSTFTTVLSGIGIGAISGATVGSSLGSVQFYDNGVLLGVGTVTAVSANSVTVVFKTTYGTNGSHKIQAFYSGDGSNFNPAASPLVAYTVNPKPTGRLV
jgi:hypothetical protein